MSKIMKKIKIILIYLLFVIVPTISSILFGFWHTAGALIIFITMNNIVADALKKVREENKNAK